MRLSATRALLERRDAIIVASVSAIYGLGDPNAYMQMLLHVVQGDRVSRDEIIRRLVEMQYTRNELEFYVVRIVSVVKLLIFSRQNPTNMRFVLNSLMTK